MVIPGHHEAKDYNHINMYPEPPHYQSAPMEVNGLSPEAYSTYTSRSSHEYPTTMAYEQGAIYAETPYLYQNGHNGSSPGMYTDDNDARGPASDLSIASASSSNVGSPLSSHGQMDGQMAPIPEWATGPHGLGLNPGIVESDYTEYSYAPDGYEYNPGFEYPVSKTPGFVGELAQIPRSSSSSFFSGLPAPPRPAWSPRAHRHTPRGSCGSISSSISCDSTATVVPRPSTPPSVLAVDTRLAQASVIASPSHSAASSTAPGLVFASSAASSASSFSSPPLPAWSSPPLDGSPTACPKTPSHRLLSSPFFSQSSGHFVAPLQTSYPILIHPDARPMMPGYDQQYPAPPPSAYPASPALSASPQLRNGSTSPFMSNCYPGFSPFPPPVDAQRRPSIVSYNSNTYSPENPYSGDESKEKQRCPHPECGKVFKDLKAHMLTHQEERPEKCPIATCEYHVKGFARKYDKNRHTLTHYKGTMVCGFCPGSGSAAEKSFNRADVFKRHLTAVHGVEQTPPNSRKKTGGASGNNANKKLTGYAPDATGKCSTCSQTFSNAQDFYEHLDDCVLRIVQQEDPAEAINAKRLAEVENDRDVVNTLEKNNLPTTTMMNSAEDEDEDENMEDGEFDDDSKMARGLKGSPTKRKGGNPPNGVQKSRGMTHSRGGYPVAVKSRGRKNRRDYPSSWGFDKGQMTMKKRVMAVFDGARRLHKDDMMLSTEQEVRIKLSDGKSYVTDLDLQTLKRAEGYLNATDEEKGPWVSDDLTEEQIKQMLTLTPEITQPTATATQ
ncbi:hypothetical protein QBC43DRAFT_290550 [Cladorrhinum sp. PSN259]|nr:hypothetical protein QBC43DRAFT_290550 [Cladorrhinum sp. PSN259]